MKKKELVLFFLVMIVLFFSQSETYCEPINVCTAENHQINSQVIPDGVGGALIAWIDYRNTPADYPVNRSIKSIYIQRIDSDGSVHTGWPINGVLVCYSMHNVLNGDDFKITSDGDEGAIIVWNDFASMRRDFGAQRIDKNGIPRWGSDGIGIEALTHGSNFNVIPDGSGGAVIAFDVNGVWPSIRMIDIYAQRINSEGEPLWGTYGRIICSAYLSQRFPELVSDGNGGAIITWTDLRTSGNTNIYAQRINTSGKVLWPKDGVMVCSASGEQSRPRLLADGNGGAFIVWEDKRAGTNSDIYMQLLNKNGKLVWRSSGLPICIDPGDQFKPEITAGKKGGIIIVWEDWRRSAGKTWCDIYIQSIAGTGGRYFRANGIPICPSLSYGTGYGPKIAQDNNGGAFITWLDNRGGGNGIFAQHMNSKGNMLWGNGIYLGNEFDPTLGRHEDPHVGYSLEIASDGYNAAFITWEDSETDIYDFNIFAQKIGPVFSLLAGP